MSIVTREQTPASELKLALANRAEDFCRWLFPAGQRDGVNYHIGSVGGEYGKSLVICIAGQKAGVYKDFATDEAGDNLLELLRATRDGSFGDACREAQRWLGLPTVSSPHVMRPCSPARAKTPDATESYRLTDGEIARGTGMAERLMADFGACETIAKRRGWQPQTVLGLAQESYLGLSEENRLVFTYDTGAKERWQENGERRMRFLYGKADALWRGSLLAIATRVFVTEGETDAISLVDAGAEQDGDTVVVALPGANIRKPHWATQLSGKDVVLCLDADAPGQAATEKLKEFLAPHVARLRAVDLQVLLK